MSSHIYFVKDVEGCVHINTLLCKAKRLYHVVFAQQYRWLYIQCRCTDVIHIEYCGHITYAHNHAHHDGCLNPSSAELFLLYFSSSEARIANTIFSFKFFYFFQYTSSKLNYLTNLASNKTYIIHFSDILFVLKSTRNFIYGCSIRVNSVFSMVSILQL